VTEVNLANCQQYLVSDGYCESLVKSQCEQLVSQAHEAEREAIPTSKEVLPGGDMLSNATVTAKYIEDDRSSHYLNGLDAMYVANNLSADLSEAKNDDSSRLDDSLSTACTQQAAANGNPYKICSCTQYAFDTYHSVRPFEQKVAETQMDYRALFDDARAVMSSTLRSKDGLNQTSIAPHQEPRSKFYSIIGGWGLPYPSGTTPHAWDAALRSQYSSTKKSNLLTLESHVALAASVAGYPDEKLNYLFDEQEKFEALVAYRAARWDAYREAAKQVAAGSQAGTDLATQAATELRSIDAQLEDGLRRGVELGCVPASINEVSACDWSPKFFYKDLQKFVTGLGERRYQDCVQLTGDSFDNTAPTVLSNSLTFANHLTAEAKTEKKLGRIDPGPDGLPTIGQQFSDEGRYGNDDFNVSYDYNFSWGLTDYDQKDDEGKPLFCKSNLRGGGTFNVDGAVFGATKSVVDFDAWAYTKTDSSDGKDYIHEELSMKLLGNDIFEPINAKQAAKYSFSATPSTTLGKDGQGYKMSKTFVVVAVPVTVQGGLTGTFGVDIKLDAGLIRDCEGAPDQMNIGVQSNVKPYVDLDAFLAAGIGWSGLSAGVKGEVNLVEAELPFTAKAGLEFHATNSGSDLFLVGKSDLKLKLKTLDGKVKLYVEYLIGSSEREIFSWPGYTLSSTLFDFDAKYPLIQVAHFPGASTN
jgi:hypothetical protein